MNQEKKQAIARKILINEEDIKQLQKRITVSHKEIEREQNRINRTLDLIQRRKRNNLRLENALKGEDIKEKEIHIHPLI